MGQLLENSLMFKNLADENIKEYCDKTGDNIEEVTDYLRNEADPLNTLIPIYFYTKMYKLSIDLINQLNQVAN